MKRWMMMFCLVAAAFAACGGKAAGPEQSTGGASATSALYDRLGRRDAIADVVKDFVEQRVAKDARINAYFARADLVDLENKLTDQICQVSGGPCTYIGKDMRTAHTGMNVRDSDWIALVEDLKASLDHFHVGAREQQELLGALAKMHDDIVTAK